MKRRIDNDTPAEKRAKTVSTSRPTTHSGDLGVFSADARRFIGKFPFFREPKEIGNFSLDCKRQFLNDRSRLRYYRPPDNCSDIAFSLRCGYSKFIKRNESVKEYLDNLLKWIEKHRHMFLPPGHEKETSESLFTDFVSWRGLLTRLLCTPYENRDGWKIAVIKFKGTLYLCEYDTAEKVQQQQRETERQKEMSYWGYKFEQYVTADSKDSNPDTTQPVDNIEEFGTVLRSRLDSHSLVFGAEVDCVDSTDGKYIELKTSREIENRRQDNNFRRFKLIKWWTQSFLAGIPRIVCGFRDDEGVVNRLETFHLEKIVQMSKDIWDPSVCYNFCNKFLSFVKQVVVKDDHRIAYLFESNPLSKTVSWRECPPSSEYTFLPQWYINSWETKGQEDS